MNCVKINDSDLRKLKSKLQKQNKTTDDFLQSCAKELAARLLRMVIKRTPVGQYKGIGKVGGTLRRGWTTGTITKEGSSYKIDIVNPVEYATYVEYGHRTANHSGWIPGQFFMTISEQELEKIAPKILENKIKKYLEGVIK